MANPIILDQYATNVYLQHFAMYFNSGHYGVVLGEKGAILSKNKFFARFELK